MRSDQIEIYYSLYVRSNSLPFSSSFLRSMFDFCDDTGLGLFPATWTSKSQSGVRRNSSGVVSVERSSQPAFLSCLLRLSWEWWRATKMKPQEIPQQKKQGERERGPATHMNINIFIISNLESQPHTACTGPRRIFLSSRTLIRTKKRITTRHGSRYLSATPTSSADNVLIVNHRTTASIDPSNKSSFEYDSILSSSNQMMYAFTT